MSDPLAPISTPFVEERLEVGKRWLETGRVLIANRLHQHAEEVDLALWCEQVEVPAWR